VTDVIEDVLKWLEVFTQRGVLIELAALAVCVVLAWLVVKALHRSLENPSATSIWFGRRLVDGVLFPLVLLCLGYAARALVHKYVPLAVFKVAIPALLSLVVIRVGVRVLHLAFADAKWITMFERSISWLVWGATVMWVSGLLPIVLDEMEQVSWKLGGSVLTLRNIVEGALTAGAVLIVMLWISAALEARLLRDASGGQLSLRKAVANATRTLLMTVGVMVALSAVGIDLTALSVLGGAIGVGIGLGLQKLAANYVSGFVILTERSMRIGDMVRVDNFEGRITDITARYTVIRSLTGRESIVPNELLITSRVENLSLADPKVWQSTVVSVGYDSNVELVSQLLLAATVQHGRVLADPAPSVALSAFGADGLEFTVGYWIGDPENGQLNIRSQINMAILAALKSNGIEIPFPQRVVRHVAETAKDAALPASTGGVAPVASAAARPQNAA
jgi:small-conductance mechanosensitive channel